MNGAGPVAGTTTPERVGRLGFGLAAVAAAAFSVMAIRLLPLVDHHLAGAGAAGPYFLAVAWAVVLGATVLAWPIPEAEKPHLLAGWAVKALVTVGLMLAYEARYPFVDGYGYYREASSLTGLAVSRFGDGTGLVESIVRAHLAVLPDGYHVVKVSFSFIGLFGLYLAYRATTLMLRSRHVGLLYLFLLFPSLLFWTSILGKDPLALLGISMCAYGIARWWRRGGRRPLLWAAVGILVAASVRLWLGAVLLLPTAYLTFRRTDSRLRFVVFPALGGLLLLSIVVVAERFGMDRPSDVVDVLSTWSQAWARGGSAQVLEPFRGLGDVLAFLPLGMFTALFRPLPGDVNHTFGLIAGAENLVMLLAVIAATARDRGHSLRDPLLVWVILVVLAWAGVYAFLSYQNLGTGARFRVQILPLLLAWIVVGSKSRTPVGGLKEAVVT